MQINENKQLNIQQKQNYPDSVASYDTQPGNEVGLFYNGPEHHTGQMYNSSLSVKLGAQKLCGLEAHVTRLGAILQDWGPTSWEQ